jgi:hypothetical protein
MGDTALGLGDLTGAEQWHCASLQSSRSVRESQSIEITLPGLGKVVTERGDIDASGEYCGMRCGLVLSLGICRTVRGFWSAWSSACRGRTEVKWLPGSCPT